MKKFDTSKDYECKLRIYNSNILERLNKYIDNSTTKHKSQNDLFLSLILDGLELEEVLQEDYQTYANKLTSISEKLSNLQRVNITSNESLNRTLKSIFISLIINERLLSRLYNMLLNHIENTELRKEYIEAQMYDDLPQELYDFKKDLEKVYDKQTW